MGTAFEEHPHIPIGHRRDKNVAISLFKWFEDP
jgi:hypothetical protein